MALASHLRALQALELSLRLGSLKAAADALAITPAAAGQRIKALEAYLGLDLLVRGRSGLRPAPALAAALPHLAAAFRELDGVAEILDLQRGQEIHVAAASDFAELWLKPRLARFKQAHPNIQFCINGEGDVPMRFGPADCEIGFMAPRDGAELLFRDYVLPISSPENTLRISRRRRRDRLEGFPLLHLDFYKDDVAIAAWPAWIEARGLRRTAPGRGIRFQRITAVLDAVLASAGITLCGVALLSDLIDRSELSLPFGTAAGNWSAHAFQCRFRPETLSRPQLRRFRDWLSAESAGTRQWLEQFAHARNATDGRRRPRVRRS